MPAKTVYKNKQSNNQSEEKIEELAKTKSKLVHHFKTVFPFNFFPDELIVETDKVTFVVRDFFFMKNVFPVLLENINGVRVYTGPFFATLALEISGFELNPPPIKYFWIDDAVRAKRLILGLVEARRSGVDFEEIDIDKLKEKIEKIGKMDKTTDPEYTI